MQEMVSRQIRFQLEAALMEQGAVYLNGPRQCGKSTLARTFEHGEYPMHYVTFDDPMQVASALAAPDLFLKQAPRMIIDEVQLVPELARHIKVAIDEDRRNEPTPGGRFLLTGSANILALPKLSDALVGRIAVFTLYPFSISEVIGSRADWLDQLWHVEGVLGKETILIKEGIRKATFPIISSKAKPNSWLDSYLSTLLQRDVKSLVEIEKLSALPLLTRLLASRAGQLINDSDLARSCGLTNVTCHSYRTLLEQLFLTHRVEPWFRNIGKRLVKSPKVYFTDTLLLIRILGLELKDLSPLNPQQFGHVLENFVASEIIKSLSICNDPGRLFFYRTAEGQEVDFVIEKTNGKLIGIEVKATTTVGMDAFKGLHKLAEHVGDDFQKGIVLYLGTEHLPFGKNCWAIPLGQLLSMPK